MGPGAHGLSDRRIACRIIDGRMNSDISWARQAHGRRQSGVRIAVLGGGPGGLYFAALAKQLDPRHQVHLWERNAPGDTFGFGVVFSDETLGGIEHADAVVFAAMERDFARWDDIDVHCFAAMSRHRLLAILQQRCAELGVRAEFSTPAPDALALAAVYDLVAAADGANSPTRARLAGAVEPELEARQ